MNIYLPFICLGIGALINYRGLNKKILKAIDILMNISLYILMFIIGVNIGINNDIIKNITKIGINSLIITLISISFSVIFVFISEKFLIPLEEVKIKLLNDKKNNKIQNIDTIENKKDEKLSFLIFLMPVFILIGIISGYYLVDFFNENIVSIILKISLIFLYGGVGVSLSSNKSVFIYVKKLGFRIIYIPVFIFFGCIVGGIISGFILGVDIKWTTIASSGMGYYSLTGAFLTEVYGIEAGIYGFMVNVFRDVLTVILLPLLVKISKGSPIASGAAGCMDTMLVPVSKAVGTEISLVALITGTILTFVVPLFLPLLIKIFDLLF